MIRRRVNDESGSAMVEFSMILPIFLLVAWCVVDFARAFYTSNSLSAAVREGARTAAVGNYFDGTQSDSANAVAAAKARVTQTFNSFGGPAITPDSIKVNTDEGAGLVTVQVKNYIWSTSTPINVISGGQIKMTRTATFRLERTT